MSDDTILEIRVIPRASTTRLAGTRAGALLVRLAAPPVDGAANSELIDFLSRLLEIPKRQITIISGETGRQKRVKISGVSAAVIAARLPKPHDDR